MTYGYFVSSGSPLADFCNNMWKGIT